MDSVRTSKLLSLILRHDPGVVGVELDEHGWVDVDVLLSAINAQGHSILREQLEHVVQTSDKKRFSIAGNRIRANQGHSVKADRHHVHLSSDTSTARSVGKRHGEPVVLCVDSGRMAEQGFVFFQSTNGVWLVDRVPAEYLIVLGGDT